MRCQTPPTSAWKVTFPRSFVRCVGMQLYISSLDVLTIRCHS